MCIRDSGNTVIKGNTFLPEKGVSISYIEGKSYTRKKLVSGSVYKSKSSLPEINNFIVQKSLSLLSGNFNPSLDSIVLLSDLSTTKIENSFLNKTLVIFSNSDILLDGNWNLEGNIIVFSKQAVVVENPLRLNNILICAKNIRLSENINASVQLISSNSIQIDSNSNLLYPSSVIAVGDSSSITFKGNSTLSGTVISLGKNNARSNYITLAKETRISGLLYCDNQIESKGKVEGKLIAKKLFYKSPSTSYINTLIDAEISNDALPDYFSTTPLLKNDNPVIHVIKWLK